MYAKTFLQRSFRQPTATKNNQLKHGGSFFHRRLSSKSPNRNRKAASGGQTKLTSTGEICVDDVCKPHHGPLLGHTMSTPAAGNGYKEERSKSKQNLECSSSANAIIGGDITSKKLPAVCQVH